jgi:hypothetical protein
MPNIISTTKRRTTLGNPRESSPENPKICSRFVFQALGLFGFQDVRNLSEISIFSSNFGPGAFLPRHLQRILGHSPAGLERWYRKAEGKTD